MNLYLEGKKVIITGGTKGIGRACVLQFCAEGAEVSFCSRSQQSVEALEAEIRALGGKAHGKAVDLYDKDAYLLWLKQAAEEMRGVDIFVSNVTGGTALGMDAWGAWKEFFDVDLMCAVDGFETLHPYLSESKFPAVTFVSSTAAIEYFPPSPPGFMALKSALITHAKTLAHHHGKTGIRVNTVSPGPVYVNGGAWEFVENEMSELYQSTLSQIPLGRMGTPDEVGSLIAYLSSPLASFITGSNLVIDGGLRKGL
ncbi:SDR family oxidoreductase [Shewanella corallii]|uniref:SDR family oxidoreductase n=1 Tax=Shewanella corallii TaxID=560080 RepID=A0ABT0NAL0_9GAMM|nr:SDR family oxidoreductase [Shewanella corallii]MCL2915486.1 SDR family oxidoreductase [Shewanella corallii]